MRNFKKASLTGTENYYKPDITWTRISTGNASFRYTPAGSIPNMAGLALYCNDLMYYIGLLNSKVIGECLAIMNPTINYPPGTICKLPVVYSAEYAEQVRDLARRCIEISKCDYDSFEQSWDYMRHPLVSGNSIREQYCEWERECNERFDELKEYEEQLNKLFIEIYGLSDEMTPEVKEQEITVNRANLLREIKRMHGLL